MPEYNKQQIAKNIRNGSDTYMYMCLNLNTEEENQGSSIPRCQKINVQ